MYGRTLKYTFEHPEYECDYDYEYEPSEDEESECISEYRYEDEGTKGMTDEEIAKDLGYLWSDFRRDWFYDIAYEAFCDDDDVSRELADQCDGDPNSSWDAPWGCRY